MSILKVDKSFFKGDAMNIPNISSTGVGTAGAISAANADNLTQLIEKKEPEFLKKALGKELYQQFKAGMSVVAPVIIDPKWLVLSVMLADSTLKVSPLANYVWWYWARYNTTVTTDLGESTPSQENAGATSSVYRQVHVWNEMVDMLNEVSDYINDNEPIYGTAFLPDDEVYTKQNTFNL